MRKVLVTRDIPRKGYDVLEGKVRLAIRNQGLPPSKEELLDSIRGMEGLLCLLTDTVDEDVMDAAPGLRVISNYAVGFDNIDVDAATGRGIPVGHTPGVLTETTADFAFALLCSAARRVVEADRFVRDGKWKTWEPKLLLGSDLWGSTLGIIGYGRIGQAVARRARGFQMKVLFTDPRYHEIPGGEKGMLEQVDLDVLLEDSDFVSIHTPLTAETSHLLNAERLSLMKQGAILINTARGGVVDPGALFDALQSGHLAAAALDVTDPEPLPLDDRLLHLPNLVLTPHMASASVRARDRMAVMAAENLLAGLLGERLPFCANPQVYGM